MDSDNAARVEAQTRELTAEWMERVIKALQGAPGAPEYPLSVLLLSSPVEPDRAVVTWMTLCDAHIADWPNGKAQALYMSRDLLTMLARLDADFKLGMQLLPAVIATHPLFVSGNVNEVTELVEDGASAKDGSSVH